METISNYNGSKLMETIQKIQTAFFSIEPRLFTSLRFAEDIDTTRLRVKFELPSKLFIAYYLDGFEYTIPMSPDRFDKMLENGYVISSRDFRTMGETVEL